MKKIPLTPLARAEWWVQQVLLLRAGGPPQGADIPDTGGGAPRLRGTPGKADAGERFGLEEGTSLKDYVD